MCRSSRRRSNLNSRFGHTNGRRRGLVQLQSNGTSRHCYRLLGLGNYLVCGGCAVNATDRTRNCIRHLSICGFNIKGVMLPASTLDFDGSHKSFLKWAERR
jgi:hypothetical protein